jgi:hypothetical protein
LAFLQNELSAWDSGALDAHRIGGGPTRLIVRSLEEAKRKRGGILAKLIPTRRRYLDGLIEGLEKEMEKRRRD